MKYYQNNPKMFLGFAMFLLSIIGGAVLFLVLFREVERANEYISNSASAPQRNVISEREAQSLLNRSEVTAGMQNEGEGLSSDFGNDSLYRTFPDIDNSSEITEESVFGATQASGAENSLRLPEKNTTLPDTNYIKISKIGVDTQVFMGADSEIALKQGAWIADDFNTPSGNALVESAPPVIIASHVYGYPEWSDDFRSRVAFAGLKNLQEGDRIEVVWQQRQYNYEVVAGEINTEISSYDHDLILYTCNDLEDSGLRVIKYARLVT